VEARQSSQAHGKATARALTANELLKKQEKQLARQQRQQEQFNQAQGQAMARPQNQPPDSLEGSTSTQITRKESPDGIPKSPPLNLVIRTPERPRRRRAPSPETPDDLPSLKQTLRGSEAQPESPEPPESPTAPASTAPPALGRGKRKKVPTARMAEARDQHLV